MLSVLFKLMKDCKRFVNIWQMLTAKMTRWQKKWHDDTPMGSTPYHPHLCNPSLLQTEMGDLGANSCPSKKFSKKIFAHFGKGPHPPSAWSSKPRSREQRDSLLAQEPKVRMFLTRGIHRARVSQRTWVWQNKKESHLYFKMGLRLVNIFIMNKVLYI